MNRVETGGPAFPLPGYNQPEGMSMRDYFAAQAMQGIITGTTIDLTPSCIAAVAFAVADAMLAARNLNKEVNDVSDQ